MNSKRTGRLVGAALVIGVTAIVAFALIRQNVVAPEVVIDDAATDLPEPGPSTIAALPDSGGAVQDIVKLSSEAVWTRMDPETGELRYRMEWDQLEPAGGGVFEISAPRAWVFQGSRIVEISAERGRLIWPSRDREPESGRLEGDVVIEGRMLGAPESDPPLGRLETDSLNFNTTFGEMRTEAPVVISAPGLDVSGTGFTLRFNAEASRPLTYFRIDQGGSVVYDQAAMEADERLASDESSTSDGEGRDETPDDGADAIALYSARFEDDLSLDVGDQRMIGGAAELWVRLVDGRLAKGSIASFDATVEPASGATRQRSGSGEPADAASAPVELTWTGPMEIRALPAAPNELERDDAFIRVLAPTGGVVELIDEPSATSVNCVNLEYGATRRDLAMYGVGPLGVTITAPSLGEVVSGRFDIDLTSGVGEFSTPGIVQGRNEDDEPDGRELRWRDRLSFAIDTTNGPVGSPAALIPDWALFEGGIDARDGAGASVRGETLRAEIAGARSDTPSLERLILSTNAEARSADGGRVTSDILEVDFETPEGESQPRPVLATARGNVEASQGRQLLHAGEAELSLETGDDGRTRPSSLEARSGVETRIEIEPDEPGVGERPGPPSIIDASGDRLSVTDGFSRFHLLGEPALLTLARGDERSEVTGNSISGSDQDGGRGLIVFGPGTATHSFARPTPGRFGRVHVEWQGSMQFDDGTGEAEAIGAAVATAEFGDAERHIARGERIAISLQENRFGERELASATVESDGETNVEVELRRFVDSGAGAARELESMANLRGPQIDLDALTGVLEVPGAGLLLVEDRRDEGASGLETRGTMLLEWDGSMTLERGSGRGQIRERARMTHRARGTGVLTELECETLDVGFDWPEGSSAQEQLTLRTVRARDAVFVRHGTMELLCDSLTYDSASGIATAIASPGNTISVFNTEDARSIVAEAIEIDLLNGGWAAVRRPSASLVPN